MEGASASVIGLKEMANFNTVCTVGRIELLALTHRGLVLRRLQAERCCLFLKSQRDPSC
jgi:hypothetical protein